MIRQCAAIAIPAALAVFGPAGGAEAQSFHLPLDCGASACVIQNYADVDSGPEAEDPACGRLTYDGHDGLDFRVPGIVARAGVKVLSPAAGVVRSVRDGEADGAMLSNGKAVVDRRECGNGILIDHLDGWSSQLCHLRRGSVTAKAGDAVAAGQGVGLVGLSGFTQFPHVHLTLRRDDKKVEPVSGALLSASACSAAGLNPGAIWSSEAKAKLGYTGTQWFELGFAGKEPAQDPSLQASAASRNAPALVFWALAIAPKSGDMLRVRLYQSDGSLLAEGERVQPRDQAQAWLFAGRRTPSGGWPAGVYRGEATLMRGKQVLETRHVEMTLAR